MSALLTVEGVTKYFNQRRVLDDVGFSVTPLDGKHLLDHTLAAAVSGKIGVWSKTDSVAR